MIKVTILPDYVHPTYSHVNCDIGGREGVQAKVYYLNIEKFESI